jgi:hypothetical protein
LVLKPIGAHAVRPAEHALADDLQRDPDHAGPDDHGIVPRSPGQLTFGRLAHDRAVGAHPLTVEDRHEQMPLPPVFFPVLEEYRPSPITIPARSFA